jgi:acyl-CoA thioesterase FadM
VYRHSSTVTADDTLPLVHDVDPTAPGYGHHLSFDRILRRCGLAWTTFLQDLGSFGDGVIVPRLEVDYLSEVHEGGLDVDVAVLKVGRTSFRIRCAVSQDGRPAATVEVVLVSFAYDSRAPLPLTGEQRERLEPYLVVE